MKRDAVCKREGGVTLTESDCNPWGLAILVLRVFSIFSALGADLVVSMDSTTDTSDVCS